MSFTVIAKSAAGQLNVHRTIVAAHVLTCAVPQPYSVYRSFLHLESARNILSKENLHVRHLVSYNI